MPFEMPLDVNALRDKAKQFMDEHVKILAEFGTMPLKVMIVGADGTANIIEPKDDQKGHNFATDRDFHQYIRDIFHNVNGQAVMLLANSTMALFGEGEKAREAMATMKKFNMSERQAADLGLCKIRTAVTMRIDSPLIELLSRQYYCRDPNKKVLLEEYEEEECVQLPKYVTFFNQAAAGNA